MLKELFIIAESDTRLKAFLDNVVDYARVYFFAKMRQKGCEGLGEMTNLKDEFKGILDEMLEYCNNKGYIADNLSCDIDAITDEIVKRIHCED